MKIGMIGLGRMGANISRRLMRGGHEVVAYDRNAEAVADVAKDGAVAADSLADMAARLDSPAIFWVMLPAGPPTEGTIEAAMEEAIPVYVLSAALYARYRSRVEHTFGDKLLSAMRFGFGGHVEIPQ